MADRITQFRDSLGAAESYLHAIKMAFGSSRGTPGRDKDCCALVLLLDAAQREIGEAQALVDDMEDQHQAVDDVDIGEN